MDLGRPQNGCMQNKKGHCKKLFRGGLITRTAKAEPYKLPQRPHIPLPLGSKSLGFSSNQRIAFCLSGIKLKVFRKFDYCSLFEKKKLFIWLCWALVVNSGPSLHPLGFFFAQHRLSSCGTWVQLPQGMWHPSSQTRDLTGIPCIARWILNHWTTREVPIVYFQQCAQNMPGTRMVLIVFAVSCNHHHS